MFRLSLIIFSLLVYCYAEDSVSCGDSLECIENNLKSFLDKLEKDENNDGLIKLKKIARISKNVKDNEDIIERCVRFLKENEVRVRLPENIGRNFDIEGRSKRYRKMILPLILLLKLKAAIIIPIVLSLISFLAFVGFKSGLAAFAISGAVALKSFLENHGQSKVSYEILPSIASGWSRTSVDGGGISVPYENIP